MLSRCTTFIHVSRGVQPLYMLSLVHKRYQCYQGCKQPLSIFQGYTKIIINISRGVLPLSILAGVYKLYQCCQGIQPLAMLVGVYNLYPYYQGYRTFINVIRGVNNLYQCLSVCLNTFTNIIRDDQSL